MGEDEGAGGMLPCFFFEQTPGALAIHLGRKENDPVYEENRIENHTYLSTSDMRTTPKV
jgi:hypothetical protein